MKEGFYTTPTQAIPHGSKIACVIGTFIRDGKIEEVGARSRRSDKLGTPDESVTIRENKLDCLKFVLACYEHYNAGVDYQLILVDNGSPDAETVEFLKAYSEEHGAIFLQRENSGFSFGAYKHAWDTFKSQYDYYLFHEQDVGPCKDGWLSDILLKFMSVGDIGAVGNIVEGYRSFEYIKSLSDYAPVGDYERTSDAKQCNLDGMFMFTSSRVLEEVDTIGGLNVKLMKLTNPLDLESWDMPPGVNEMLWQHPIMNLGYKLASFDDGNTLYTHGIGYRDFGDLESLDNTHFAPIMHSQTLYCNPRMQNWFSWYPEKNKFFRRDTLTATIA